MDPGPCTHGPDHSSKVAEIGLHGEIRLPRNSGWNPARRDYLPALANLALDGLEQLLRGKFPKVTVKSAGGQPCVNFIRYADDFIITGRTKELLEREIKPLIVQFLRERGLELSQEKTVITHVTSGFDFLGQNVRRYPNGVLLIAFQEECEDLPGRHSPNNSKRASLVCRRTDQ